MFLVLTRNVNSMISLEKKTSQATALPKSKIGEFENISATNAAEYSMTEQALFC